MFDRGEILGTPTTFVASGVQGKRKPSHDTGIEKKADES